MYFTSYFCLFKYMVSFLRYFTVCITYQPPLVQFLLPSVCVTYICMLNCQIVLNVNTVFFCQINCLVFLSPPFYTILHCYFIMFLNLIRYKFISAIMLCVICQFYLFWNSMLLMALFPHVICLGFIINILIMWYYYYKPVLYFAYITFYFKLNNSRKFCVLYARYHQVIGFCCCCCCCCWKAFSHLVCNLCWKLSKHYYNISGMLLYTLNS